jgi:multidrug efflux pump subunit AcrA (membrane-fusion protein)
MLLIIDKAHAEEGLTAQVYNVLGQNASPYIPQGASPVVTTNVPNIDFQWGSGSVLGGPSEDVIVRFTGSIRSDSTQDISFLATADDGTKLYIDGVLVADDWRDKGGGGTISDPISFTAGIPKTIELMYYENGGGANVFLYWDQSGSMEIVPASAFTSQAAPVVKTIGPPRNLTISSGETSTVLNWEAPDTGNTQPERYAISFNCTGCNGWGIATGNVGGPNSLNTTITIDHSLLNGLMPAGTVWSFHIRSDNDTFALYSANSNVVTGSTYVAPAPEPSPTPTPSPSETTTATTPNETTTVTTPTETTTVTTPSPSETSTVTIPTGPTEAEIAASVAAQAAAQQAEAARIQAETAALIAAQAAAAQAEAERIAAEEAAREAARIKAEAEAQAEADRIEAEIEAARIQAEIEAKAEEDRIAAELKAAEEKAEAEAKAEAERIEAERIAEEERIAKEAEEEAERIAAEEEAIAEAKAKAEAEALAEEKRIAEEAEAKELEEEKAAEEEAQAKEEELNEIIEDAKDGKELTEEQKEVVVAALIENLVPGESISAAQVQESGISYSDLPPETPIELRTSESGEVLIITAEVAANVELVQDPGALLEAVFTDPGAALAAFGSIGADMTEGEREEATEMVVATVVAAGAAINAAAVATGGATGGSTGGGGSSGGGSGSNSPGSRGGRRW